MEKMAEHFDKEAEKHDSFFLDELGLKEFYDEIENQLGKCNRNKNILVLGCGSGLEVERIKTESKVTAVDISENMIMKLKEKKLHNLVTLKTICGSFLDITFEKNHYDIVLSCYAMHHFNETQKIALYKKLNNSLAKNGVFLNGDSMVNTLEEEKERFERAQQIYDEKNMPFASLHIDVHFCYEHELEVLHEAGFDEVILERKWHKTRLYRAVK